MVVRMARTFPKQNMGQTREATHHSKACWQELQDGVHFEIEQLQLGKPVWREGVEKLLLLI